MVEILTGEPGGDGFATAARLLADFNAEYGEPAPPPEQLAARLAELVAGGHLTVLLARDADPDVGPGDPPDAATAEAVGVAALRIQPSLWSRGTEAYLAELYVVPSRRGRGHGRELITEALRVARGRDADYAYVITSEDDVQAQRLYEAAGFRRTEGDGGPLMLAYEQDL